MPLNRANHLTISISHHATKSKTLPLVKTATRASYRRAHGITNCNAVRPSYRPAILSAAGPCACSAGPRVCAPRVRPRWPAADSPAAERAPWFPPPRGIPLPGLPGGSRGLSIRIDSALGGNRSPGPRLRRGFGRPWSAAAAAWARSALRAAGGPNMPQSQVIGPPKPPPIVAQIIRGFSARSPLSRALSALEISGAAATPAHHSPQYPPATPPPTTQKANRAESSCDRQAPA